LRSDEKPGAEYAAAFDGLRRFFGRRGVPPEEAADLAQEALTRTFVHIERHGRANDDLWPLLTTVARNLYADRGRRSEPAVVPITEAVDIAGFEPSPDEVVVERERRRALRAAVASLPPRHRRTIELELRGMTPADIARELGIKRNAADALLHRARRSLASKLESMRGAFAALPLVVRARYLARRISAAISAVDPTGGLVAAATALSALTVAGALSAGPPVHRSADLHLASGRTAIAHAASVHAVGAARQSGAPKRAVSRGRSHDAALVRTRVGVERLGAHVRAQDPADPNQNDVGVDVWQQPDGRPSPVTSLVDQAAVSACASTAGTCSGGGGP
jgi:RNA polymerase sigma-70 factor (ECF subfamily)